MAENKSSMSTKLVIIIVIGAAFVAGYFVARERYKPQILRLGSMVIERDEKISTLNNLRNRLVLKEGVLVKNKDGEITAIEDKVMLTDGSSVTVAGVVTRPSGEKTQLEEGDSILMDGEIMTLEEVKEMEKE